MKPDDQPDNQIDSSYTLIKSFLNFANQKKTVEEILHFFNIHFENTFGATAIMFITKSHINRSKILISRGVSHDFVKKFNENPNSHILKEIESAKGSIFINFKAEPERFSQYQCIFEPESVSELYGYELKTGYSEPYIRYSDSYIVITCSINGFKNCGIHKSVSFDTIFSILSYILNINNCVNTIIDTSHIDYVSGLYRFKYFHEMLFKEMQKTISEKGTLSIALISMNQLNEFNSVFGHVAGDKNIALIADIIKKHIRVFDTAARYGNKFVIFLPNMDKAETKNIIKNVFSEIEEDFKRDNTSIISLNAGIASYPVDGDNERVILDTVESRRIEARRNTKWVII
jgi:diguanylate cyclase (GGDEF)-like protein